MEELSPNRQLEVPTNDDGMTFIKYEIVESTDRKKESLGSPLGLIALNETQNNKQPS